jgi:hypothetical protein
LCDFSLFSKTEVFTSRRYNRPFARFATFNQNQ